MEYNTLKDCPVEDAGDMYKGHTDYTQYGSYSPIILDHNSLCIQGQNMQTIHYNILQNSNIDIDVTEIHFTIFLKHSLSQF